MLSRKDLVPGKMYTLYGKVKKLQPIAIYKKPWASGNPDSTIPYKDRLYPRQPFVYIDSQICALADGPDDPWYEMKILTGDGLIGYIQVHDDDFAGMYVGFTEWTDDNI